MPDAAADEQARRVAALFDLVAPGYDVEELSFFAFVADRLVARLNPRPGEKVLDVAAGTGAVALAAAQAVAPGGRVTAVDLAEGMLARLEQKARKFAAGNIDLHVMDAAALEFRRDYFHHTVCSFGLFFLPDMAAALKDWVRVTRPGGTVAFTSFGPKALQPMTELLLRRFEGCGLRPRDGAVYAASERLKDPDQCRALAQGAGLVDVDVRRESFGYHLKDAAAWWQVVWNSGLRASLVQLAPAQAEELRAAHLAEVAALAGPDGIWLDVETNFTLGRKPASP
jgi:ubiquinone/menaquinone biosynthesis C-methylase UbiE